jgi:AcrR family transcriptional regulator
MPSITRRPSSEQQRQTTTESQVAAAVERLLAGGAGFTELGVRQILDEAGIARSTFYAHYRDKTDLLLRVAGGLKQKMFDTVLAYHVGDHEEEGVEGLADSMLEIIKYYREHAPLLRAVNEVAGYDSVVRDYWNAEIQRWVDACVETLTAEKEAGRAPADLDVVTASELIIRGGDRQVFHHVAADDGTRDVQVARELALIQWYGVFRRPASPWPASAASA